MRPEDVLYTALDDTPLARSLAVVGISGPGNAGSLAARYLIGHLHMKLAGTFEGLGLPPAAASYQGLMAGAIQVWSAEKPCGADAECERLLVIKNDVPLDLALVAPLAMAIAGWAAENGVSLLVGIDSYPRRKEDPERVLVGASVEGRDTAARTDAAPLDDVIVMGLNAALVATSNHKRVRALAFYGPRDSTQSDASAAAAALASAQRILPPLDLDDAREDIERIERDLERQIRNAMGGGRAERGFRGYA